MMSPGRALCCLPLLALGLQGCVAAVIPLAAAGAMSGAVRDKPDTPQVETRLSRPTPPAISATPQPAEETQIPASRDTQLAGTEAVPPADPGLAEGRSDIVTLPGVSELPPPSRGADSATFARFADYALDVGSRDPLTDEIRPSAILASPDIFTPDRAPCRFNESAVLIDLDPAEGDLDTARSAAIAGLPDQLQRLRAADIEIVWSTSLTADRAGDIRAWLAQSGLDPAGEDRLLLLRYPDDRKQTRRQEAAKERCLVAMLGDERSDFDELFDYLKRPGIAFGLDKMLGQGWFLAPIPGKGLNP